MSRGIEVFRNLAFCLLLVSPSVWAQGANGNSIDALDISSQAGKVTIKLSLKNPPASPPVGFTLNNPPRIALDFPATGNGLGRSSQDVNQGDLRTIRLGQSGARTRVVFNLAKMVTYDTRVEGNAVLVTLQGADAAAGAEETVQFAKPGPSTTAHSVRDVDFRRGRNGEAQVIIELADNATGIDLRKQGKNIVVDFLQTALPLPSSAVTT
jgi:type IV pilus assembly protein PilQ